MVQGGISSSLVMVPVSVPSCPRDAGPGRGAPANRVIFFAGALLTAWQHSIFDFVPTTNSFRYFPDPGDEQKSLSRSSHTLPQATGYGQGTTYSGFFQKRSWKYLVKIEKWPTAT